VGAPLADGADLARAEGVTLPEHVRRNRAQWTRWAPEHAEWAPDAWAREEFTWGVWGVPERELGDASFLTNGTLSMLCAQDEEVPPRPELRRPYFGMHRFEWPEDDSVEFHLGYGDRIRL
jgi:hypothetical protein